MSEMREMAQTSATAVPHPGVWPCLGYRDAEAALRFLTGVFGFEERAVYRSTDGARIEHAELRWPEGGGLMFGSTNDGERGADGAALYVVTADPDAVHERAVAAGATVRQGPYDADYGSRNVTIADPEGASWTFGTYTGS